MELASPTTHSTPTNPTDNSSVNVEDSVTQSHTTRGALAIQYLFVESESNRTHEHPPREPE